MSDRVVYLMRGLPACGKSYTARQLAGDSGIVLETDQYFHTEVGDDPAQFDYREDLLPAARSWNFARFQEAVARRITPIVVDRGNGLNPETQRYARHAVEHGYHVELKEPESDWWREIRELLRNPAGARDQLDEWAKWLSERSRETHRVSISSIRTKMHSWHSGLTVEEILNWPAPET